MAAVALLSGLVAEDEVVLYSAQPTRALPWPRTGCRTARSRVNVGVNGRTCCQPPQDTLSDCRRAWHAARMPSVGAAYGLVERRGRDSNPRSGGAGLRFSRPVHSTALPPLRE